VTVRHRVISSNSAKGSWSGICSTYPVNINLEALPIPGLTKKHEPSLMDQEINAAPHKRNETSKPFQYHPNLIHMTDLYLSMS
jgi:hypothetical protein